LGFDTKRKHTRARKENRHQEINVEDSKNTKGNKGKQRGSEEQTNREREKQSGKGKRGIRSHWFTTDPRVEMAFFTSSTFTAENLNKVETEACLGN